MWNKAKKIEGKYSDKTLSLVLQILKLSLCFWHWPCWSMKSLGWSLSRGRTFSTDSPY